MAKTPSKKPTSTVKKSVSVKPTGKKAGGLYQSTNTSPRNHRPRYYTQVQDTPKAITQYDRTDSIRLARSLFTTCPDLGGALLSKTSWVVSPGSFTPIYTGENTAWGDAAETFLTEQFFPICSVLGTNYPFEKILSLSSLALDVDGDSGLFLTQTRTGFPQIGLIASHRIGQRTYAVTEVKEGRFQGYKICDGVIVNDSGQTIGYRVLGDKEIDDRDYSTSDIQLLFEAEWGDQLRGISKIARSITDWANQDDINEFLLRGVKLASSIGLIHKTESGDGNASGWTAGQEEDPLSSSSSAVQVTAVNGGEIQFLKAAAGESIEALKDERPSPNTLAFFSRIHKLAMYSIGWPQELLDPSKIGGASTRLIQELVNRSIATRQQTLERRAKLIVSYAVAKAMKNGFLPSNDKDWFKWSFTKGGKLTVDNGNEAASQRDGFRLGSVSLSEIASSKGQDWYELRNQRQKETEDLLTRAKAIADKFQVPFETALTLLQANTPNQSPVSQPQPVEVPLQQAA